MLIGALQVEFLIPDSDSLKRKRMVIGSLKQRLQNKFNVSVAEIDYNDLLQRSVIGVAMVANEKRFLDQAMAQVLNFLDDQDGIEIVDHT
ncbi:MAG: DUF503 domain-containing protein, partial [candidate division KSB1 bacterium]|nr:DUF503 domain-containing protein [candidate division KSB1 bacterium]